MACIRVEFHQTKNGVSASTAVRMKALGGASDLVVDRLHARLVKDAGVFNGLLADAAEATVLGRIVNRRGEGVEHAAGTELRREGGILGIVGILRLLLGVQVVEIAEELIEAMHRRQELVAVAEVVLAELPGGVAERLEQLGDGRIFRLQAERGARWPDLGQAGANRRLSGDEGGAAGRTGVLPVPGLEARAFGRDAVDVGRAVAHHAIVVATAVPPADVVAPNDQEVGLCSLHRGALISSGRSRVLGVHQPSSTQTRGSAGCRCRHRTSQHRAASQWRGGGHADVWN